MAAISKHTDSQNEEESTSTPSNTVPYDTSSNYSSSSYSQSDTQQNTLSSDMAPYGSNHYPVSHALTSYSHFYRENNPSINYSQHSEPYPTSTYYPQTNPAAWSEPQLPVRYNTTPAFTGHEHSLDLPHAYPPRNASYPPASYHHPSFQSYDSSNDQLTTWTPSPQSLPSTTALPPPTSYPPSPLYATSSNYENNYQYSSYAGPSSGQISTPASSEAMLSPYTTGSVPLSASPRDVSPANMSHYNSSGDEEPSLLFRQSTTGSPRERETRTGQYTFHDQLRFFRDALLMPSVSATGPFIPQSMYKPHTNSDRRRYVEEVDLDPPIYFWLDSPSECGISLADALHSRVRRLVDREQTVFEGRGPSVSIRLEWPGYRQWSRQIPTKDFRTPPGPITKAKLAKNVAKCVQRFINERQNHILEDEADLRFRVGSSGTRSDLIKLEDLVLVSMHHVSMGSWQPQLRLIRPLNNNQSNRS